MIKFYAQQFKIALITTLAVIYLAPAQAQPTELMSVVRVLIQNKLQTVKGTPTLTQQAGTYFVQPPLRTKDTKNNSTSR